MLIQYASFCFEVASRSPLASDFYLFASGEHRVAGGD